MGNKISQGSFTVFTKHLITAVNFKIHRSCHGLINVGELTSSSLDYVEVFRLVDTLSVAQLRKGY